MKDWKIKTELQNGFQAEHIRDSELKKLPFLKLRTAIGVEDRPQARLDGRDAVVPPHPTHSCLPHNRVHC